MSTVARHLYALAKPRIVLLLVFTAAAGVWKAAAGSPEPMVLVAVVLAGAAAAAGSNLINQGLEPDIDAMMRRTRTRPVASRQMYAPAAIAAGLVLVAASPSQPSRLPPTSSPRCSRWPRPRSMCSSTPSCSSAAPGTTS